jgi:hypothetical protein
LAAVAARICATRRLKLSTCSGRTSSRHGLGKLWRAKLHTTARLLT